MNLIDMHCDTLWKLMEAGDEEDLMNNRCSVNIEGLRKADASAQFFACFIFMKEFMGKTRYEQAYEYAKTMILRLKKEIWQYQDEMAPAFDYDMFERNKYADRISAFLTIEEGGIIHNDMKRLEELYDMGIRLITLLWNEENCMGYPNSIDPVVMAAGLKPFGIETVEKMNDLGMIIDVSHLSDGGFWDVMEYSCKPVAASHSNARSLCNHPRNLSDGMLKALGEKGGVAGVNFYPVFLGAGNDLKIEEVAAHMLYMMDKAGEEAVAVGTDFDGFDSEGKMEIPDIGEMGRLAEHLKGLGVTERQIDKIWSQNVLRVVKETL